jgi:Universal stress protein UspA and related nucleotide-binding proteins
MDTLKYNRILIAVDGSKHSLNIAEKGLTLARQLKAEVAIIFVIDKSKAMGSVDANITPEEAEILLKKEAIYIMDSIASTFGYNDFIRFMPVGYPKEDIIKISDTWHADVIVIGRHGKSGIINILMGSVAEYVLYHSHKIVMLVK